MWHIIPGGITLGAVVATLTSTMGDAAFLLIATRPIQRYFYYRHAGL